MKRFFALALVLGFALSAVALADHNMDHKMGGTITKVDTAQKTMTVKGKDGKETTIYWNDQTKMEGDAPKEGAMVWYKGETKDGKMWVTWFKTGAAAHKM